MNEEITIIYYKIESEGQPPSWGYTTEGLPTGAIQQSKSDYDDWYKTLYTITPPIEEE